VDSGAEQAEGQDGEREEEEAAYLASAFVLPTGWWRSGLWWHGVCGGLGFEALSRRMVSFEVKEAVCW
jgi:hypothetical protein